MGPDIITVVRCLGPRTLAPLLLAARLLPDFRTPARTALCVQQQYASACFIIIHASLLPRDNLSSLDMPDVVFIHGLFGWGEHTPLFGLAPTYFPADAIKRMWEQRGKVVFLDVGVASSDHDRACEAYAQIRGNDRVDYGAEHANRCGHTRYKKNRNAQGTTTTSSPLTVPWSANAPIHVIGHSFGGNTALKLVELLQKDYWGDGTSSEWIVSVTCICSPLRGCTFPFVLGLRPTKTGPRGNGDDDLEIDTPIQAFSVAHAFGAALGTLFKLQMTFPSICKPIFDLHSDQWRYQASWTNVLGTKHRYWTSNDNMVTEVTPGFRHDTLRERLRHLKRVYLLAVVADKVKPLSPLRALACCGTIATLVVIAATRRRRVRLGSCSSSSISLVARLVCRAIVLGIRGSALLLVVTLVICCSYAIATRQLLSGSRRRPNRGFLRGLGRRLQLASEPFLPRAIHALVVYPFLRLCSHFVGRAERRVAAVAASHASLRVPPPLGTENDGFVEIASQCGLSAANPSISPMSFDRRQRWKREIDSRIGTDGSSSSSSLKQSASETSLPMFEMRRRRRNSRARTDSRRGRTSSGSGGAIPRAMSAIDIAKAGATPSEDAPITRGRWCVMAFRDSDHSLGTWVSGKSVNMYQRVLSKIATL